MSREASERRCSSPPPASSSGRGVQTTRLCFGKRLWYSLRLHAAIQVDFSTCGALSSRFSDVGLLSLEVGFLKHRKAVPDSQHIASYMAETSGGDGPFPRPGALPQERLQARPRPRTDSRPLECLGLVSWCQGETKRTLTLGGPNFWESMLIVRYLCI